jgi:hypothetical protein
MVFFPIKNNTLGLNSSLRHWDFFSKLLLGAVANNCMTPATVRRWLGIFAGLLTGWSFGGFYIYVSLGGISLILFLPNWCQEEEKK